MIRRTHPIRHTRLKVWRRPKSDKVTPETVEVIRERERWQCVAPLLDHEADACYGRMTVDHVGEMRMGKRAPSDASHCVLLCWHHHLDGWATAHRPELRAYLIRVNPPQAAEMDATA